MSRRRILLAYSSLTNAIPTIPNNEIWYTSKSGNVIAPNTTDVFGANIVSNTYSDGKGIITFDGDVTMIGDFAFLSCISLTSVTIPDSVTTIGVGAFRECTSLTSITIPDGVTSIDYNTFFNCRSLTSVTIGNGVTWIGNKAFEYCDSLTSVYCKAITPPTLRGNAVFDNNGSGRKIYVPYQSLDAYKTATNWSEYADDIVGYDFENDTVVGGGKQVNTITLRPYISNIGALTTLYIDYNALFPISSEIIISITTNGMEENGRVWLFPGDQIGTKMDVDIEPSSSDITVTGIDPQEDDTYIYEVVVEY